MRLGKTNLEVNKNGFGALPIQRCTMQEAVEILKKAYDNGIDFYDTAHFYTDSEEKMGNAFKDIINSTTFHLFLKKMMNYLKQCLKRKKKE